MSRRWITGALVAAVALVSAGTGAWAASTAIRRQIEVEYRQIQIQVDGKSVTVDAEPFLYVEKGRVFIPARPLAEALGAKVEWQDETSTVQVYTHRYLTARVEGDRRIFAMPGAGFEIRAPLGWIQQEADPSALLHLALPDASGLNGLVAVTRLPEDPSTLSAQFDQVVESMRFVYGELQLADRTETSGQVNATGTARLAGQQITILFRMVEASGGHYLLLGIAPQASQATVAPAIEGIFNSFALR